MSDLYKNDIISGDVKEAKLGEITEQDRLIAAKQILLGLGILFGLTVIAYLFKPTQGEILLEICKTTFPPLATLIIAFYFNNKS